MEKEKVGIKNVTIIFNSIVALFGTGKDVWADQKVSFADLALLPKLISDLAPLADLESAQVWPELKDLDHDEMLALLSMFEEKFDLADDTMEMKIETGLRLTMDVFDSVMAFVKMIKA